MYSDPAEIWNTYSGSKSNYQQQIWSESDQYSQSYEQFYAQNNLKLLSSLQGNHFEEQTENWYVAS